MPELPEVETTLQGIKPALSGQTVETAIIRHPKLRWPVPRTLPALLSGQKILSARRRAKYLLLEFQKGTLVIHLGMSGCLRLLPPPSPPAGKHDHVDIVLRQGTVLRYCDPRRFGAILWTSEPPEKHPLLSSLGPEPFDRSFSGQYLLEKAKGKTVAIKPFIMNNRIVVGVGNIYATEALYLAGIHPATPAGYLSIQSLRRLASVIRRVLSAAIKKGGTTLRDFARADGKPGYFSQTLKVYGRTGLPCVRCKTTVQAMQLGQRNTAFCPHCQPRLSLP